jgi:hypothetical protein
VRPEGLGKFKNLPHRISNLRPSDLYHSAHKQMENIRELLTVNVLRKAKVHLIDP